MLLEQKMKQGLIYKESGHTEKEDIKYEQYLKEKRKICKDLVFQYNQTLPSNREKKYEILTQVLGSCPEDIYIEGPMFLSYGCHTSIGEHFYANFNMTIVDDIEVTIGKYVMFGPNVTLSVTGHPLDSSYRQEMTQYSLPIHIEDHVWIGANVVVLPGVTIGEGSVIGAGSVVTKDIPSHTLAYGIPCRVIREIDEYDREYYRKGMKVNYDW